MSHILANPYAHDGWKVVQEHNPLNIDNEVKKQSGTKRVTLGMLKSMGIIEK